MKFWENPPGVVLEDFFRNMAFQNCICYNASRLKRYESSMWMTNKYPGAGTPGYSISFYMVV